jgi:poly(A) polymerase Pap1
MVILTPTKPHKNITRNVTRSTAVIIKNELRQAHETIQNCIKHNLSVQWNDILNPYTEQFFKYYPLFLQVTISAITKEEFLQW